MLYSLEAAAAFAAVASFTDLKWHKIPNWLVLLTLVTGLGYHGFTHTLSFAWYGFLYGTATILFYLFGIWAPGDVKFMAAVGSLVGSSGVISILFFSFVFFFVYSIWFLNFRGNLKENLKREFRVIHLYGSTLLNLMMGLRFKKVRELSEEIKSCQAGFVQVPFGIFIGLGVFVSWLCVKG